MPGPSSSTTEHRRLGAVGRAPPTCDADPFACRVALSSRLRTTCVSCRRLPSARPPDTAPCRTGSRPCRLPTSARTQLVEVDRDVGRVQLALFEAGELEEVVDECAPAARPRRAARCASAGQSAVLGIARARPRGRCASTATGLRSSCDASDTNWRWRADAASSRSSISFIVSASRRDLVPSVPAPAPGGRMVVPVIAVTSARIASTGRSARPAITQASAPTSTDEERGQSQSPFPSSSAERSRCRVDSRPRRVDRPVADCSRAREQHDVADG